MLTPDFRRPLPDYPELQDFLVMYAVHQFNRRDKALLTEPLDVLKVTARVAYYIQIFLWLHQIEDYVVDLEHDELFRGVDITAKKTRPRNFLNLDIVVHKRATEEKESVNALCIEIKEDGKQKGNKAQENRLQKLTDPQWSFGYPSAYVLCAEFKSDNRRNLKVKRVFREGEKTQLIESPFN